MKRDFKHLVEELGKKKHHAENGEHDFEKISEWFKDHQVHLRTRSLKRMWSWVTEGKRPQLKTLNRLALFAGFQNWQDLLDAVHGDSDAQINYEDSPVDAERS